MPVVNKYNHYPLGNKKTARSSAVVSQFGGVDFSSQSFNVSTSRAINIQNFIYRDGVVQKRNGYEEIYQVHPVEYFDIFTNKYNVNGVNFNGIWKFKAEDGVWHVVAHIGNLLFEIKNIESENSNTTIEPINVSEQFEGYNDNHEVVSRPHLYKFEDYKSFAFVGANRLWFLGGNKYMCLRFTTNGTIFCPVENAEDTFIPTTTYGITYTNSNRSNTRTLLDYPNKLTYFRKNKLISGTGKDETEETKTKYFEYLLDAPLILNPNQEIVEHTSEDISKIYISIKTRRKDE